MQDKPLLIKSILGEEISRPPVWLMRQAGRYMSEYRALKEKYTFLELCRTPELALEVTMQPINFLDPDAAIIFSDILIPLESLGFEIDFNPGPKVANPIRDESDVNNIPNNTKTVLHTSNSLKLVRKELENLADKKGEERKALLGFSGAPWTLACYVIDQQNYKGFLGTKIFASRYKKVMHKFLERIALATADYLLSQIEAGADAVQIFDSWGGILNEEQYKEFSAPYINMIIEKLGVKKAPVILYTNGGDHLLNHINELKADCISIDWRTELKKAEQIFGNDTCIQGNLDSTTLFKDAEQVKKETNQMLSSLGRKTNYIANLGHGILPRTPPENVATFVKTVKEFNF